MEERKETLGIKEDVKKVEVLEKVDIPEETKMDIKDEELVLDEFTDSLPPFKKSQPEKEKLNEFTIPEEPLEGLKLNEFDSREEPLEEQKEEPLEKKKPIMYQLEKEEKQEEKLKELDVIHVQKQEKEAEASEESTRGPFRKTQPTMEQPTTDQEEEIVEETWKVILFGLLGFFIPIGGLVIYLAMKDSLPKSSIAAGIGALCNTIVLFIAIFLFIFIFMAGIGAFFI